MLEQDVIPPGTAGAVGAKSTQIPIPGNLFCVRNLFLLQRQRGAKCRVNKSVQTLCPKCVGRVQEKVSLLKSCFKIFKSCLKILLYFRDKYCCIRRERRKRERVSHCIPWEWRQSCCCASQDLSVIPKNYQDPNFPMNKRDPGTH